MNERNWLVAMGATFGGTALLVLTSMYLGWHLGRQSIQERIIVPAADVDVAPAQVTIEPTSVRVAPPSVRVDVPQPEPPHIEVKVDVPKAQKGDGDSNNNTGNGELPDYTGQFAGLRQLGEKQLAATTELSELTKKATQEVVAARFAIETHNSKARNIDEHGELLPPPHQRKETK